MQIMLLLSRAYERKKFMLLKEIDDNVYPLDINDPAEMARLMNQDRFVTRVMGDPLSAVANPDAIKTVIDIACGPGGWALDVAFAYPHIDIIGIDSSDTMINYAKARAQSQKIMNASFERMNIFQPLDFDDAAFDLVNARFLTGVLLRTAWSTTIDECTRILRPDGTLRWTEPISGASSSAALEQLQYLTYLALSRLGFGFSPTGHTLGTAFILPKLFRDAGYTNIQINSYTLEFSAGTEYWADCYHNIEIMYRLGLPALAQTGVATKEELEHLYNQMLIEMNMKDFCAMRHFINVTGQKPIA
jgi:ubiquinone/menaquinone biosynthesis C-methylase UbiE